MTKAHSPINWQNSPSVSTPINESNLNKMDKAIGIIDDRVVSLDTTKANQTDMLTTITNVSFDESTGIFTFTRKNGTTITLDTKLEKLILNWDYDSSKQILYLILSDGTKAQIDFTSLISQNEFIDSRTIRWVVGSDGKVKAEIISGSVTADMIEPNYLANLKVYAEQASSSASTAVESAEIAQTSANLAKDYFDGTVEAIAEINKKLNIAEFEINDGYLTYNDDATYNFTVIDGYLDWEVAE